MCVCAQPPITHAGRKYKYAYTCRQKVQICIHIDFHTSTYRRGVDAACTHTHTHTLKIIHDYNKYILISLGIWDLGRNNYIYNNLVRYISFIIQES